MKKSSSDRLLAVRPPAAPRDADAERPTLIQLPAALADDPSSEAPTGAYAGSASAASAERFELERELDEAAANEGPATLDERLSVGAPSCDPNAYLGQVLDNRYVVEDLIARGGMGVVYRCRHRLIGKQFAVKIIRSDMVQLPDAPRRFLMEATAASAIGNEHIIDIFDYGLLSDGASFLVMELLQGVTLAELIKSRPLLSPARIISIGTQVCEGLRAAHDAGIVHRDLKPENIFLLRRHNRDFVKVLDFGIAKMSGSTAPLTQRGLIIGTPHYMAPEQAAGNPVDERGDIYSLGVILYELTTGQVPFDASHYMAVLGKHMNEPPPPLPPSCFPSSVAPAFEAVVLRCLAKRPEDRFRSMAEVGDALEELGRRLTRPLPRLEPTPVAVGTPRVGQRNSALSVPAAAAQNVLPRAPLRGVSLALSGAVLAVVLVVSIWRLTNPGRSSLASGSTSTPVLPGGHVSAGSPASAGSARGAARHPEAGSIDSWRRDAWPPDASAPAAPPSP
jgi:eukaryotic-like serine/threonine-protein kinase